MSGPSIPAGALRELDQTLAEAFRTGRAGPLRILGYGEISAVIAWPADEPRWACKRLPPFRDADQLDDYRDCFEDYVDALQAAGVGVVPTELARLERDDGVVAYLVQPALDPNQLAPRQVAQGGESVASQLFERLAEHVVTALSPRLGIDGQLSNWVVRDDGSLAYLDLTTPMLRDEDGRDRLDADLFLVQLPWLLRGVVYRFLLEGILDKYFDPRGVLLDAAGNLVKERLEGHIDTFLAAANSHLDEPLTESEARRYYRGDSRTWAFLQGLRRLDRGWQRHVRRRVYPFLLPEKIAR